MSSSADIGRVLIIRHGNLSPTETFIRTQATHLSDDTVLVHGWPPRVWHPGDHERIHGDTLQRRIWQSLRSNIFGTYESYRTAVYESIIRRLRPQVVLAQYGMAGVMVMDACRKRGIPLYVHFHGYDASKQDVFDEWGDGYRRMFGMADGVIGVSRFMCDRLLSMGADPDRLYWNACGVDLEGVRPAQPESAPPTFVFAGRFVEKKAPHLTIQAFARVYAEEPSARLLMIGDGELMGVCRDLVTALGLQNRVSFVGARPHREVLETMRAARANVQHSVTALSGDMEGTPVAVMEAAGLGLPVVSTRHAGIPDVIDHGRTGLLVEERDVETMASYMIDLAMNPLLAGAIGSEARQDILAHHTDEVSVDHLRQILSGRARPYIREKREPKHGAGAKEVPRSARKGGLVEARLN